MLKPFLAVACGLCAVAAAPAAVAAARVVEITPATEGLEVNRYFSPEAHGPSLKFYAFPAERIVVVVRVAPTPRAVTTTAEINVFPAPTDAEGLGKWINNQHSDAIHPDVPQPERRIDVQPERLHTKVEGPLDHEVGGGGDEYDRHRVDFSIDAFTDGDVQLKASRGSVDTFVRTKALGVEAAPEPR